MAVPIFFIFESNSHLSRMADPSVLIALFYIYITHSVGFWIYKKVKKNKTVS